MRRLRRQMQPVFQDPYAALNPRMNVLEIVTEPFVIHKREMGIKTDRASLRVKAIELLARSDLDESALLGIRTSFPAGSGSGSTLPARWRCGPGC